MDNTFVPVLLFAYARPDHLARTLSALKENGVQKIFAFADGAKTPDKEEAVLAVRKLLGAVDWCDISIVEREKNLGLGVSIITGVTELFKKFETLIIVEDDVVMRPGAYIFLCTALEFYKNDPRIFSVSLWSHPQLVPVTDKSVFFCPRFNCWGWGAYRRSWAGMEYGAEVLLKKCMAIKIDVDAYGTISAWALAEKNKNTWATRFALLHYFNNGVNVWPTQAWVDNIGCDGTGTNAIVSSHINASDFTNYQAQSFPKFDTVNAVRRQFKLFYDGTLLHRWVYCIRRYIFMLKDRKKNS